MGNTPSFSGYSTTLNVALIKKYSKKIIKKKNWSVPDLFAKLVAKYPFKAVYFNEECYTYSDLDRLSNKIANWALEIGLTSGDIVPLMLDNCPEYLAVWLGLAKIGATAALINTNLTGKALEHCLNVALEQSPGRPGYTHTVIMGSNYHDSHEDVKQAVSNKYQVQFYSYHTGRSGNTTETGNSQFSFNRTLADRSDLAIPLSHRAAITFNDPIFYIYTSGTTGLPKAAKISHLRFSVAGYAFKKLYHVNKNDSIYVALPLYHSNGGMLAISLAWHAKANIGLRKKFSATNYFSDCQKYNCTVGVYIGEICRYIAKTAPNIQDTNHPVRLMIGNGLRPDVWEGFVNRFGVVMGEFYGSTEGNANLFNTTGRIGAIGYLPWQLRKIYPVKIAKFSQEDETLVRNDKGFCQECDFDEVGEAIGLIRDDDATRKFDGYTDATATKKKIAESVFRTGDKWFRTGDLLKMDSDGYVYFVDRIGDTYRWKGENVATTEVSEVISKADCIFDSNVYGVSVPGADGCIGMAAIRLNEGAEFNGSNIYQMVNSDLPKYARPYFLRILQEVDMTGTFKYKKVELRKEGFNLTNIMDPIYILDDKGKTYIKLDKEIYYQIQDGTVKL